MVGDCQAWLNLSQGAFCCPDGCQQRSATCAGLSWQLGKQPYAGNQRNGKWQTGCRQGQGQCPEQFQRVPAGSEQYHFFNHGGFSFCGF